MKKIPTAEEFLEDNLSNPTKGWSEKKRLIEFAKLHVEAALKEILENVPYLASTDTVSNSQIKEAILNSYSLDNVK